MVFQRGKVQAALCCTCVCTASSSLQGGDGWGQSPLSPGKELGDCATGTADAIKGRCRKKVGYGLKGFSVTVVRVIG